MNATELAHWRYRVKAITADVDEYRTAIGKAGSVDQTLLSLYFSGELGAWFTAALGSVDEVLHASKYLLEEARYMVELGELTLT